MNWNQRREREHMLEEAEAIALRAKDEQRQLTDAEIAETDKLLDDADGIARGAPGTAGRQTTSNEIGTIGALDSVATDKPKSDLQEWRTAHGEITTVLSRDDRWADLPCDPKYAGLNSDDYSLGRFLVATVTNEWTGVPETRFNMTGAIQSAGGAAIPEPLIARFIDSARAKSVAIAAGMKTIPMPSRTLDIARITADPISDTTTNVFAEGATIGSSDLTLDKVQLTASKFGRIVKSSRELVMDSPNAARMIEESLAKSWAAELDRLVFQGTDAQGIIGLSESADVSSASAGGAITYEDFLVGWEQIKINNFEPNGIVMSPHTAEDLAVLLENSEANHFATGPLIFQNLPKHVSMSCPSSSIFIGDFTTMILGLRQNIEISISTEANDAFAKNEIWFRLIYRWDMQPESASSIFESPGLCPDSCVFRNQAHVR
ncbi:MAG: phage major capsid protein [Planctomycetes bacterium]|nr:phage major capsid protein [Planctomycetota bacterium]